MEQNISPVILIITPPKPIHFLTWKTSCLYRTKQYTLIWYFAPENVCTPASIRWQWI